MNDKKNKLYDYQPSNPDSSKMPNLKGESEVVTAVEKTTPIEVEKVEAPTPQPSDSEPIVKPNEAKSAAQSLIAKLKAQNEPQQAIQTPQETPTQRYVKAVDKNVLDSEAENFEVMPNVVMPDPNSEDCLQKRKYNYKVNDEVLPYKDVRGTMKRLQKDVRANLTEQDTQAIIKKFAHKVIRVNKKEIVIKHTKFGYKFYKNNNDQKWWVVALKFEEPFNPKDPKYITFWSGNSFIGYGFTTLEECLNKADNLILGGRTGDIVCRDYVVRWNKERDRFIAGENPTSFEWKEYQKIIKWYENNKIRIHVKDEKVKDQEDLLLELREQKAKGIAVNPLTTLRSKMLEAPRKAVNIFGYPVKDPHYKGKEITKAENKLYQIAFSFTE